MIAFAHYTSTEDIGGVSTWLEGLILHLRSQSIPVSLFLRHLDARPFETELHRRMRAAGVQVDCQARPRFMRTAVRQVLSFLDHHQPSVFLPQCLAEHMYAARICGGAGLPWVFTHHSDDPFYWKMLRTTGPGRSNGSIVAVSSHIAGRCRVEAPDATAQTIPYGVALPPATAIHRVAPFRVVYSGRLVEEQKRISLVLQTFVELCRRDPRIECRVLGDGPELQTSRQAVAEAGYADRIVFLGRLDASGVREELSSARALLLMSDYEGLPLALLEAMAVGVVPVCRSIASGVPEVVRHRETGLLTGEDPAAAATSVLELVENAPLWTRCSKAAADLVRTQFGAPACHDRWLDLLRPFLDRPVRIVRHPANHHFALPPCLPECELTYMRPSNAPARYTKAIRQKLSVLLGRRNTSAKSTP
jgi:colanic acid/amylovoran biosynthesis glycosyltransferase